MSPAQKFTNLFNQIDTSGSGSITQAQFDQAFQSMNPPGPVKAAGADAVWKQLDPKGSGTVSKQNFVAGMAITTKQLRGAHHHHHSSAGAQQVSQAASALSSAGNAPSNPASGSASIGSILNTQA